jgi:hypothetical protein
MTCIHPTILEMGHDKDIPLGLALDQDDMASVQESQHCANFRRSGRQSAVLLPTWSGSGGPYLPVGAFTMRAFSLVCGCVMSFA